MKVFLKNRWFLLLVLIVFIICKIPHLSYPYYWDESWPYAPAIKAMYSHGISLMPNAIDTELSRGHPLFFHAIAAIWMHLFGSSHVAMHSFALFISILFLIAIYEITFRLFNKRVAIMSILLVATQTIFFIQSSFVLFEILVACLAFLGIYFYVKDKYFLAILSLTALFYTKESGLVAAVVLGLDALVGLYKKQDDLKKRLLRFLMIALPCVLIGVNFIIQKIVQGWYIFPFYQNHIEHSWSSFWYNFRMSCVRGAFYDNYKFYYFIFLLVLSIIAAIKNKNVRYMIFFLPAYSIYYMVDDMRAVKVLPDIPFFILFLISAFYFLYIINKGKFFEQKLQRRFIVLSGLFVLCFLIFSTLNFLTYRYLLAAIIPLLVLTAIFYDMLIANSFKRLYYPLLIIILLPGIFSYKYDYGWGDADFGAFDAMDTQQAVVRYMQMNNLYTKSIGTGSFLQNQSLANPYSGYVKSGETFKNVHWDIDQKTDYALFFNVEMDGRYNNVKNDSSYKRVFRYEKGKVWAEIYERSMPK